MYSLPDPEFQEDQEVNKDLVIRKRIHLYDVVLNSDYRRRFWEEMEISNYGRQFETK